MNVFFVFKLKTEPDPLHFGTEYILYCIVGAIIAIGLFLVFHVGDLYFFYGFIVAIIIALGLPVYIARSESKKIKSHRMLSAATSSEISLQQVLKSQVGVALF